MTSTSNTGLDGYGLNSFMRDLFAGVITPENVQAHLGYVCTYTGKPAEDILVKIPSRFDMDHRNKDVDPRVLEAMGLKVLVLQ